MQYQPLDTSKHEIRLLYFVPQERTSFLYRASGRFRIPRKLRPQSMIRLEMRTVSLMDFTSKSLEYMALKGITLFAGSDYSAQLLPESLGPPPSFKTDNDKLMFWKKMINQENIWYKDKGFGRWSWGDYITLSYYWGSSQVRKEVELNGHAVEVTENLWEFLHQASQIGLHKERRIGLWIDALCINQKDKDERNKQVKRMKDIYLQALSCVSWLGKGSEGCSRALEVLSDLSLYNLRTREERFNLMKANRPNKGSFSIGFWRDLLELVSRPYWTRLWIIQEIALSHNNVSICCGDQKLLWPSFYDAITTIFSDIEWIIENASQKYDALGIVDHNIGQLYNSMNRITHLSRLAFQNLEDTRNGRTRERVIFRSPDLSHLLWIAIQSEQKLQEDKVYGILGLVDQGIADLVSPNYDLAITEVFTNFAKAVITSTGKLNLLVMSRVGGKVRLGLPTWVPDWTITPVVTSEMTTEVAFDACRGKKMQVSFSENRLVCQGFIIDEVDGLGYSGPKQEDGTNPYPVSTRYSENPYETKGLQRDAFWRTLVTGRNGRGRLAPESYASLLDVPWNNFDSMRANKTYIHVFHEFRKMNNSFRFGGQDFESYFPQHADNSIYEAQTENWFQDGDPIARVVDVLWGRRLMTTNEGHLGLASRATQQGDLVCILFGCDVPAILRLDESGTYSWIGEAYMHGIMEGQAMDWLDAERYVEKEFVIV